MQGQGVLFGQVVAVFSIVIAGVWSATQWTAAALGYPDRQMACWCYNHESDLSRYRAFASASCATGVRGR
jgi:hypothetical protein